MSQIVIVDSREYTLRLDFERGQLIEERLGKPLLEADYGRSVSDLGVCLFYMTGAYKKRKLDDFFSSLNGSAFGPLGKAIDRAFADFIRGPEKPEPIMYADSDETDDKEEDLEPGWIETEDGGKANPVLDILMPKDGGMLCKPKA